MELREEDIVKVVEAFPTVDEVVVRIILRECCTDDGDGVSTGLAKARQQLSVLADAVAQHQASENTPSVSGADDVSHQGRAGLASSQAGGKAGRLEPSPKASSKIPRAGQESPDPRRHGRTSQQQDDFQHRRRRGGQNRKQGRPGNVVDLVHTGSTTVSKTTLARAMVQKFRDSRAPSWRVLPDDRCLGEEEKHRRWWPRWAERPAVDGQASNSYLQRETPIGLDMTDEQPCSETSSVPRQPPHLPAGPKETCPTSSEKLSREAEFFSSLLPNVDASLVRDILAAFPEDLALAAKTLVELSLESSRNGVTSEVGDETELQLPETFSHEEDRRQGIQDVASLIVAKSIQDSLTREIQHQEAATLIEDEQLARFLQQEDDPIPDDSSFPSVWHSAARSARKASKSTPARRLEGNPYALLREIGDGMEEVSLSSSRTQRNGRYPCPLKTVCSDSGAMPVNLNRN